VVDESGAIVVDGTIGSTDRCRGNHRFRGKVVVGEIGRILESTNREQRVETIIVTETVGIYTLASKNCAASFKGIKHTPNFNRVIVTIIVVGTTNVTCVVGGKRSEPTIRFRSERIVRGNRQAIVIFETFGSSDVT